MKPSKQEKMLFFPNGNLLFHTHQANFNIALNLGFANKTCVLKAGLKTSHWVLK